MISTGDTHITRDQGTAGWEERMPKTDGVPITLGI